MPFHSTARLEVEVVSKSGEMTFKESSSNVVSFAAPGDQTAFEVQHLSRKKTGDKLDPKAWRIKEVTERYENCVPGVRMFVVIFRGPDFTPELRKKDAALAVNLYRSILAKDTIRFSLLMAKRVYLLDVELSYRLRYHDDKQSESAC